MSANLEMAADSWDAAFRAAEFGALLIPAVFEHSDIATVTVAFGEQGGDMVDYSCSRSDSLRVDWRAQLKALDGSDGASWPRFFNSVSAYEWRNAVVWQDITSAGWADGADSSQLPLVKP